MKRQVILLLILGIISLTARGQNSAKSTDVPCDTLKRTEVRPSEKRHPVNDYSGLNSLRARLANRSWDGRSESLKVHADTVDGTLLLEKASSDADIQSFDKAKRRGEDGIGNRYLDEVIEQGIPIGISMLVFFKGGGTELTDSSQTINIRNVADLANEYGLRILITGSADSATGSKERNEAVAMSRAQYIAGLLRSHGVPDGSIEIRSEGGVDRYSPSSANRNCRIELIL